MKKLFIFAAGLITLASCTNNDFVGEPPTPTSQTDQGAIVFGSGVNATTRSVHTGAKAAALLNNNFVVAGIKGQVTNTYVFDQYNVNYVPNTAFTTESNSNDWEYVSYNPVSTTSQVQTTQTIKYWDYSTTQYDFAAYSLGKGAGSTPTYATPSAITFANLATDSYTLTGSADELKAAYISNLVTAYNRDGVSDYGKPVQFVFRSLAAKIRLAFYETIPGYSVKDVKFYANDAATTSTTTPTLYASTAVLPSGSGTMTISFPTTGWANSPNDGNATDYNKAHVSFAQATGVTAAKNVDFEALDDFASAHINEAADDYLGRASNEATYAGGLDATTHTGKYYTILPYEEGANLKLRIDYTLVSTDGSGEEINVSKATAVVPKEFAKWNPNYAYTYIFKISDMTNGSTGFDGDGNIVTGLTPITLDAVVVDSEDGIQETITTVSNPSITTYAQGKVVTENDEYIAGIPVYIIVNTGTENATLTSKAKLFTVTQTAGANAGANPAQAISESSIDNAYINDTDNEATTWSVTDANGWVLTLTQSDLMSLVNVIDAADSPTGNEITIGDNKVAKFTPSTAGTLYAFQYQVEAPTTQTLTPAQYNATLPGAISTSDETYDFRSYGSADNSTPYGTGIVKKVSQANGWTTVLVISNSVDGFVGKQYKINATNIAANTYYELYTTGGAATGIYVTNVTTHTLTDSEVETFNATLPGAVTSNQTVQGPGKYQYKIIKVQ